MKKSTRLSSCSRNSRSRLQLHYRRRCCYLTALQACLLIVSIHAQTNNADCQLEMWIYGSQSQCDNGETPSAKGYLYADEMCRTTEIFSSPSNAFDDSFPGTYEARCSNSGQEVEIYKSGCISSDCEPATANGMCERDFDIPAGFYSLVNPPRFPVVSPGVRNCGNLYNADRDLLVVFTIFGDCAACLASLEEGPPPPPPSPPTAAPTNPFTPPPTFLRPTRAPTLSPTTAPPPAEETAAPTTEETVEPPSPSTPPEEEPTLPTLPPFLPPVGPTNTLPTTAPSPSPTQAPSTLPPSPAPTQTAQPTTFTPAPTSTMSPTTEPTSAPPPTSTTTTNPIVKDDDSSNNSGAIIGGAVGGGVAILVPLLLCAVWYGQKRERTKQGNSEDQSGSDKVVASSGGGGGGGGDNRRATPHTALTDSAGSPPFMSSNNVENAEIYVPSDREDDVSTLGTPLVGLGYIDEDEQTASVDYDYRSRGRSSVAEESRTGSVTLTSLGKSTLEAFELRGLSLFDHDDERSFDEAFGGDEQGNGFAGVADNNNNKGAIEGFDCQVPEGKLGIVLDSINPGYAPVVHALRPDSILNGHVRVGDRIVAVDGVDVAHLNHIEVSALISRKSGMPRKLTFVRRKGKNGSPNNSEC